MRQLFVVAKQELRLQRLVLETTVVVAIFQHPADGRIAQAARAMDRRQVEGDDHALHAPGLDDLEHLRDHLVVPELARGWRA